MEFRLIPRGTYVPKTGKNTVYLSTDRWDDFSFVTMFYLSLHDFEGNFHEIGNLKIGFKNQTTDKSTHSTLSRQFTQLPDDYFSLGQDVNYYSKLENQPKSTREAILNSLNDIVFRPDLLRIAQNEEVFSTSLLREVSLSVIKGQFKRVLEGQPPLTNFEFKFVRPKEPRMTNIELEFKVEANSKPSTNIHAIIGRNGVGKTTLLNGIISAITNKQESSSTFFDIEGLFEHPISDDYFSSLVSVSFSAFDPFNPPQEQADPAKGTCYFYIGLKQKDETLKSTSDIHNEFTTALKSCLSQQSKKERWLKSIETLESDENFSSMQLKNLSEYSGEELKKRGLKLIARMSSGHAVVLLTITRLVATVEEKTLVLIDEPESHLHPPLLSAFVRALAELLHDRNGVGIVATHSPVVLQEVPSSCVWKINRVGLATDCRRPEIETFGENVGVLTREVFGLEVTKSGFHDLLVKSVETGSSYQEIINAYNDQLGFEARAILKALVTHRDRSSLNDATK